MNLDDLSILVASLCLGFSFGALISLIRLFVVHKLT